MPNYYEILGLQPSATAEEIKQAYRRLARQHHPDHNHDDPEGAEKQFQIVQEAYEILIDPRKRQQYDRQQSGASTGFALPPRFRRHALDGDAIIENAQLLAKNARQLLTGWLDKR